MRSLYQVLKASKFDPVSAPDMFTALWAKNISGGGSAPTEHEYTGTVPTPITANGEPLIAWTIFANFTQSGTPTSDSPIYPSETGDRTNNLFSSTWEQGLINPTTGEVNTSNSSIYTVDYIPIKPNTIYSMTRDKYTNYNNIRFYDANKEYIGAGTTETIEIISGGNVANPMRANQNFCCFRILVNTAAFVRFNDLTNDLTTKYMLVEGQYTASTMPAYEPHGFKLPVLCGGVTTPVYTAEPLRKIGDYTDYKSESAEYRVIKKVVLTGNENIVLNGKNDTREILQAYFTLPSSGTTEATNIKCSHLDTLASGASTFNAEGIAMRANGTDMIFGFAFANIDVTVADSTAVALTKLLTYLAAQYSAGTPVCVWYVLATPTTTTVEGPEIPTSDGEQTFDVTTELEPSSVYIKYKG